MRKMICLALLLCLTVACQAGVAEDSDGAEAFGRTLLLPGSIVAGRTVTVTAPFGGTLADFSVRKGDIVSAGEGLFTINTTKVYAPTDGTVGSMRAQVGDEASFLQDRYGALLFIEPRNRFIISTDTKEAYAAGENLLIHVGETVYIGSRNSSERVGAGFVTSVGGKDYTIEVTSGNLVLDDNVAIYRSSDFENRNRIGVGKTEMNPNVPITADGSVFALHVSQGDVVGRGDLLMETVGGSIAYNPYPTNNVLSGYAAIVASVDVSVGTSVSQNQVLATLHPVKDLQVAVGITEGELESIRTGDTVRIVMVSLFHQESITGTVASISGLSSTDAEDPEYTVYIDFDADTLLRPGMNVQVYFNE